MNTQIVALLKAWKRVDDAYESRSEGALEKAVWAMRDLVVIIERNHLVSGEVMEDY